MNGRAKTAEQTNPVRSENCSFETLAWHCIGSLAAEAAADVDRNQTINNVLTVEQYSAGQLRDRKHYGVTATDPLTFGLVLVAMAVVALLAMLHSGAQSAAH
jgi:hypothetical protein